MNGLKYIEIEFLKAICSEKNYDEVAEAIYRSRSTVNTIYSRVVSKTGCKNRYGLMIYAIKNKIVEL